MATEKYRKMPIIIEAEQWHPGKSVDGVCGCMKVDGAKMNAPHVHTLEGPLHVSVGDWIVSGIAHEKYPVKDAIFKATYEKVQEA